MIVFLYGPDDYRRLEKKKEIIAEFRKKHSGLAVGFFDLSADGATDAFLEFVRSQSIFESAKLAILENAFEVDASALAKFLKPLILEKTTTVLVSETDKPVKALAFLTEKPALSQKFEKLQSAEWISFINAEARKKELKFAPEAAQFLATVYDGNSWALVTELAKLAAIAPAGTRQVDKNDLDKLDLEAAPNYWALLNGLKSYDVRSRLYALEKLFAMNDPAPKIFNIVAAQAGEKIPRMAEYDLAVKSGKLDYEEALLDFAIS